MSFRAKLREAANAAPHPTGKDASRVEGLVQCLLNAHTWSINLGRFTGLFLRLDEATLVHFAPFIQSCMKPSPFDQLSYVLPGTSIPPELASGQYAPITIHQAQGIDSSQLLTSHPANGSFRLWKKVDLNTQLTRPPRKEGAHDELIRALRTNVGAGTGEELRRLISRYEVISGNLGHQTSVAVQSSQAERAEVAKGTGLHQLLRVHKQAQRARDMSRYEITQAILGWPQVSSVKSPCRTKSTGRRTKTLSRDKYQEETGIGS